MIIECQKRLRAAYKVVTYSGDNCDYRIREAEHLKEHDNSLMIPETLSIVVVKMQQEWMASITMLKPNMKIMFSSCTVNALQVS